MKYCENDPTMCYCDCNGRECNPDSLPKNKYQTAEIDDLRAQLKQARTDARDYARALNDVVDGNHMYDIREMTGLTIERSEEICKLSDKVKAVIDKYKEQS
jgi:hypothetical protein